MSMGVEMPDFIAKIWGGPLDWETADEVVSALMALHIDTDTEASMILVDFYFNHCPGIVWG